MSSNKRKGKPSGGKPNTAESQVLDQKHRNILDKSVINSYENEKFEFAIKEADRILKTYPHHGETLAMKGLCKHNIAMKRQDNIKKGIEVKDGGKIWTMQDVTDLRSEAMDLINEGLRNNVKSHISWRVKGLVHKAEKDWDNSARAFKMALVHDKRNKAVMNDISQIFTQTRNNSELKKIRKSIWDLDHTQINAVGYLIALYLNNDYQESETFLDSFLTDYPNIANFEPVALNEICLFKAKVLNKLGKYDACIEFIDEKLKIKEIKDNIQALTLKADILKQLGKYDECNQVYKELVDINPENSKFLKEYIVTKKKALEINDKTRKDKPGQDNEKETEAMEELFVTLNEKYPKSATIERMRLEYATGKDFHDRIDAFLRKKIKKSVISLYNEIKSLYEDNEKATILNELIDSYVENLTEDRRFSPNDDKSLVKTPFFLCVANNNV